MASKHREVDKATIISPDTTGALDKFCPDLAQWPQSWRIEQSDVAIGQRIVEFVKPFLIDLLNQPLAIKSLRRHRDHIWMLGGEVIRRRYDDPDCAKVPVEDLLFDLLEKDGGPLIWPRISEAEQRSFDGTCRNLYRFLNHS